MEAVVSDGALMIAMAEAQHAVERAVEAAPDLSLEDRLKAAFEVTRNHWMVTNEDARFRAGVGGVLLTANEDEKARIKAEMANLNALSAAMSGIPVDFTRLENAPEPVGLLGIWKADR